VAQTATIEIFKNVDDVERFGAGDVIFSAGEPGDRVYVVRSGTVTIEAEGLPLEELEPGGIFGELALIDASPRSATATATTACELVVLDERAFLFHVSQTPFFALTVMRVLAGRIRRASASPAITTEAHAATTATR
jgi:CRP/FNR family transcriptional regulator, cyclic AMP receptor protein